MWSHKKVWPREKILIGAGLFYRAPVRSSCPSGQKPVSRLTNQWYRLRVLWVEKEQNRDVDLRREFEK